MSTNVKLRVLAAPRYKVDPKGIVLDSIRAAVAVLRELEPVNSFAVPHVLILINTLQHAARALGATTIQIRRQLRAGDRGRP